MFDWAGMLEFLRLAVPASLTMLMEESMFLIMTLIGGMVNSIIDI